MLFRISQAGFIASALLLSACAGGNASGAGSALPANTLLVHHAAMPIKHVVIIIQENRTFDNLFATFPGADGQTWGWGKNIDHPTKGDIKIRLHESTLVDRLSPSNLHQAFETAYDGGKMDGFNEVYVDGPNRGTYLYQYVNPSYVTPLWALAKQYVLADHMYSTESSASFTAHQGTVAGGTAIDATKSIIDVPSSQPWGCDAPQGTKTSLITSTEQYLSFQGPRPCFTWRTLRDTLDAKKLSWKYYAAEPIGYSFWSNIWNAYEAISAVRYGPEWKTNFALPRQVLTDIGSGKLASVSWVCPDAKWSDHPGSATDFDPGPSWVADIVDAVGKSKYWNSTAVIVLWDDWGGWYDHVPPPQKYYFGLGARVPAIAISPYAKKGYIAHSQYEFGSVVRFVEDVFHLPSLGTTDATAPDFTNDFFDFSAKPRAFRPIAAPYPASFFLNYTPSDIPPDTD